jgi:sugar/nucleoside kinase (ribokinase family)
VRRADLARVVVGDVINDVIVKPLGDVTRDSDAPAAITTCPGGAAANQAAWMAHLGAEVIFAGRAGAADAEYHHRELARAGVRAHLAADPDAQTGSIVVMVSPDGERTMVTDRGANLRLRRSDVPSCLLDGAAALHLTGYTFCEPPLLEVALWLLEQARARELAVTIDPGSAAFLAGLPPGAFLRWTEGAALCFPNRDEAAVLTGEPDPVTMAARLTRYYGAVVLKLGGGGCLVAVPGAAPVAIPARPADARDTTGAGDAFCGAFMSRWQPGASAADLADAAEFAVRVAATVIARFGARPVLTVSSQNRTGSISYVFVNLGPSVHVGTMLGSASELGTTQCWGRPAR